MRRFSKAIHAFVLTMILTFLSVDAANAENGLTRVSGESPFSDCSLVPVPGEVNYLNAEVEPWIAVNPKDRDHLIGVWQQDRWQFGGSRGLLTGVSRDGGRTWTRTFAHFSRCAGVNTAIGGNFERASDPWVTFSPNGTAYQFALTFDAFDANQAVLVSRSSDGGATWSEPTALISDTNPNVGDDKESITADPKDSRLVYAVWDRLDFTAFPIITGPVWFSRTTNGGASWNQLVSFLIQVQTLRRFPTRSLCCRMEL